MAAEGQICYFGHPVTVEKINFHITKEYLEINLFYISVPNIMTTGCMIQSL